MTANFYYSWIFCGTFFKCTEYFGYHGQFTLQY